MSLGQNWNLWRIFRKNQRSLDNESCFNSVGAGTNIFLTKNNNKYLVQENCYLAIVNV